MLARLFIITDFGASPITIDDPAYIERAKARPLDRSSTCHMQRAHDVYSECDMTSLGAEDAVPRILGGMQDGLNDIDDTSSYLDAQIQSTPGSEQVCHPMSQSIDT